MRSNHHLRLTVFGCLGVSDGTSELEIVLALFQHNNLVTLLLSIETSLF